MNIDPGRRALERKKGSIAGLDSGLTAPKIQGVLTF